ncbi:MAG: K+/H+ antiporter subunit F, partial [Xanthomonas perforans]|nr:K+/H+ antiporter subunit F [Xanthomonas perforans]
MTGHMFIESTIVICMHTVGLAMLMALWRLLRGPS